MDDVDVCERRFAGVLAQLQVTHGLRAPRHLIAYATFERSVDAQARAGLDSLDLRVAGAGAMVWFEDEGLEREPRDGLDPRLDCRFYWDPPEFLPIALADGGIHYGLWYDDPRALPMTIVASDTRGASGVRDTGHASMLALLRAQFRERCEHDPKAASRPEVLALGRVLDEFAPLDRLLREADELVPPLTSTARPSIAGGVGPALLPEHGEPRGDLAGGRPRTRAAYLACDAQIAQWIAQARAQLEAGRPAFALVLGRELHWLAADAWREPGRDLLCAAYRALERDALAEIAERHHAHRELRSVAVH
ncbi:DUF2228 domain-containing protein [Pseudenhygromyxa sp. WMMC2535]|uniref:ADP-ribosylation family protein n=1 Tax=Pseudenhygromyxa sp. WMMC2535 TaxID=2712867 RepID=UPI001556D2FB|nr:ADP-ribosylation family protein [Pseudenhygromyxa sp. WMMC2535]NVB37743.1 DUF2228 domain-containing protein [Pseudenhygromyxa sp. WMMC2535]